MAWIRRRINRWRNYFSSGDYAGSHGGGSSGGGSARQEQARMESIARRDMPGPMR